jgi:DNA invertase Pin-like site-specific DNA recombinase
MAVQSEKITAAYERLSKDDILAGDSMSIQNQKMIIEAYAARNGFQNICHFVDDGITGTVFRRPGLDALLEEVKAGNVATVIIKDQSRIGRDVVEVGLLKRTFEENDVRFIAAEDGLDTANGFDIMSIFRDVFNEWFVADTSKKIRVVKKANSEKGKLGGKAPYGYDAKEGDNSVLIINEEVACNVREIFNRIVAGDSASVIARDFNERGILNSNAYRRHRKGEDISDREIYWYSNAIACIIRNPTYIGTFIAQKRTTVSYKNHKINTRPEDEWVVIENHHPPIIEKETFEIVQKLLESRRRPSKKSDIGALNGLIFCSDCGSRHRATNNGGVSAYTCSAYARGVIRFSKTCSRHGISRKALEEIVISKIRETVDFARYNKAEFAEQIRKSTDTENERALKHKNAELAKSERRVVEVDKLMKRLYEDNVSGRVSDERFNVMWPEYENEQAALKMMMAELKTEITGMNAKKANIESFMKLVEQFAETTELTAELARSFIMKIVVHEPIREEGRQRKVVSQEVQIYFNHIGEYSVE